MLSALDLSLHKTAWEAFVRSRETNSNDDKLIQAHAHTAQTSSYKCMPTHARAHTHPHAPCRSEIITRSASTAVAEFTQKTWILATSPPGKSRRLRGPCMRSRGQAYALGAGGAEQMKQKYVFFKIQHPVASPVASVNHQHVFLAETQMMP